MNLKSDNLRYFYFLEGKYLLTWTKMASLSSSLPKNFQNGIPIKTEEMVHKIKAWINLPLLEVSSRWSPFLITWKGQTPNIREYIKIGLIEFSNCGFIFLLNNLTFDFALFLWGISVSFLKVFDFSIAKAVASVK